MRPHRRVKPDANQSLIVRDLRALGFYVVIISRLPGRLGGLDLLVLHRRRGTDTPTWLMVEVKTSREASFTEEEAGVFVEMEERFGDEAPVLVAYDTEDVLRWYGMV